jgi:MFS family permease
MSVFGLASVIGPTLGGAVTDHLGWRWVLFLPVPLAVFAWVVAGWVMPRVTTDHEHKLDPVGSTLMVSALVAALLGFTWGGTTYAWTSDQEVALFVGGAALLAVFVVWELRVPNPLLPPSLFRNRVFAISVVVSFLVVGGMYGALSFVPLFVQGVIGRTAQSSGVVLTPMMLSFVAGSVVAGQIVSRTGRYKVQALVGMCLVVAGFVLFSRLTTSSSALEVVRDMVVLGVGIGATMPIFSITVQSVFPHRMLGTVNSARQLFSNLGGAIAVPVMTAVVVNRFHAGLPATAPKGLQPQSLLTAESQRHVSAGFVHAVRSALTSGITDIFAIGIGMGALALVLVTLLPRVELASWQEPEAAAVPPPETAEAEYALAGDRA